MKHITVGLNTNSIALAIKELQSVKKKLIPLMIKELLKECCEYIIERANVGLQNSERGYKVIAEIQTSWSYTVEKDGSAKIINYADKAVYVEFGVGVVGETNPHPSADKAKYDYNRESPAKDADGSWHFFSNEAELDIPLDDVEWGVNPTSGDPRRRLSVFTSGAKGDMFLYNAMMDLISSGQVHKIWNNIKEKYLV